MCATVSNSETGDGSYSLPCANLLSVAGFPALMERFINTMRYTTVRFINTLRYTTVRNTLRTGVGEHSSHSGGRTLFAHREEALFPAWCTQGRSSLPTMVHTLGIPAVIHPGYTHRCTPWRYTPLYTVMHTLGYTPLCTPWDIPP